MVRLHGILNALDGLFANALSAGECFLRMHTSAEPLTEGRLAHCPLCPRAYPTSPGPPRARSLNLKEQCGAWRPTWTALKGPMGDASLCSVLSEATQEAVALVQAQPERDHAQANGREDGDHGAGPPDTAVL